MSDTLDDIAERMAHALNELWDASSQQLSHDTFEGRQKTLAALEKANRVLMDYTRHCFRNNNEYKGDV